ISYIVFLIVNSTLPLTIAHAIFNASAKYSLTFPPNFSCPLFAISHAFFITFFIFHFPFSLFFGLLPDLLIILYYGYPYYSTVFIKFFIFFLFELKTTLQVY